MSNFFATRSNAVTVLVKLLRHFPGYIAPQTIASELFKHPEYPGMLALSDVLTTMDIENDAYHADLEHLSSLKCPFIAFTNVADQEYVLVEKITDQYFIISNQSESRKKMPAAKFKDVYNGVILTAKMPANTPYSMRVQKVLSALRTPVIILTAISIFILLLKYNSDYFQYLSLPVIALTLIKMIGLLIAALLLIQTIDSDDPLVQRMCGTGEKIDCDAILSSSAAKVFGGSSWSEVGAYYFAGTILILLFVSQAYAKMEWLSLLNLLALPYTFYSIYYQVRVAKKWCKLCCIVQGVLWAEFVIMILSNKHILYSHQPITHQKDVVMVFICMVSPVLVWLTAKPVLIQAKLYWPLKEQADTFKYNSSLFKMLIQARPQFALPDPAWSIVLGSLTPQHVITIVSDPFCKPCTEAHRDAEEMLASNQHLQVRLIFKGGDKDDARTAVKRHLMAIKFEEDGQRVAKAVHTCYSQQGKDHNEWGMAYPVSAAAQEMAGKALNRQKEWCLMAGAKRTPAVFFDGRMLPVAYRLADLKYMLE